MHYKSFISTLYNYQSPADLLEPDILKALNPAGSITHTSLYMCMKQLAKGITYATDLLQLDFDGLSIPDSGALSVVRRSDTKEVYLVLPRDDIGTLASYFNDYTLWNAPVFSTPKTTPYSVTPKDMMFLYGVEEAYHLHQLKNMFERYAETLCDIHDLNNTASDYHLKPIERDAEIFVRECAEALGIYKESVRVDNAIAISGHEFEARPL